MRADLLNPPGIAPTTEESVPGQYESLRADLYLEPILATMAAGSPRMHSVAAQALLGAATAQPEVAQYRASVLADALAAPDLFRSMYELSERALGSQRQVSGGLLDDWPSAVLTHSVTAMDTLIGYLRQLRDLLAGATVSSQPMVDLAARVGRDLNEQYLQELRGHLDNLRPGVPVTVTAQLGWGNEGTGYTLTRPEHSGAGWLRRLGRDPALVRVDDRDDRAARALSDLRDATVAPIAGLMSRVVAAIVRFLGQLRDEVGFYVSCLNLADALAARDIRTCWPTELAGSGLGRAKELVDIGLSLGSDLPVVGNTVDATQAVAVIVTGANQGGKSTFLRSWGQAVLMSQAGMFVAAHDFAAPPVAGLYPHFTRVEDASMRSGRLDEELSRLNEIVEVVRPGGLVLLNESLSSTNEREGSSLAAQIVAGLTAVGVRVMYVTHLYEFARVAAGEPGYLLLRAPRNPDGSRSYRLEVGAAQPTSFGMDLYRQIVGGQ